MHHPAIPILLALAILAGCGTQAAQTGSQGRPATVSVVQAKRERVVLTALLPGRTSAYRSADIRPQVSGLIRKRLFEEGASVAAGQPLYLIDPAPFQAALDSAQAALERARANRVTVKAKAERVASLVAQHLVSQQDSDDATAALAEVDADIAACTAQLDSARINLGYTTITAPLPGRIGRSAVTEGAIVTAFQATPLATIQQLDPIYADVPQSTADLLRIRRAVEAGRLRQDPEVLAGVKLHLDDGSILPETGELRFREVVVDAGTGTVVARMVFPNPRGELLPDMFVRAEMVEGVKEAAILVPQQSVLRTSKGLPYVFVAADGRAERRMVTIEREVGDRWLVADGIREGESVVVEGVQALQMMPPGAPLPVTLAATPAPAATATVR